MITLLFSGTCLAIAFFLLSLERKEKKEARDEYTNNEQRIKELKMNSEKNRTEALHRIQQAKNNDP